MRISHFQEVYACISNAKFRISKIRNFLELAVMRENRMHHAGK